MAFLLITTTTTATAIIILRRRGGGEEEEEKKNKKKKKEEEGMQLAVGCRLPLLAALGPWGASPKLDHQCQRRNNDLSCTELGGQGAYLGSAAVVKLAVVKLPVQQWSS